MKNCIMNSLILITINIEDVMDVQDFALIL
jgi:hypothetical protein